MDKEKFGAFLSERQRELGLTQAELAAKVHVTDKAVSRWERGVGFPDINTLSPLAEALNVTLVELMRSEKAEAENIPLSDASATLTDSIHMTERKWKRRRAVLCALTGVFLIVTSLWLWAWRHPAYRIPYEGELEPVVVIVSKITGVPILRDMALGVRVWHAQLYIQYLQYKLKYDEFYAYYETFWEEPFTVVRLTGTGVLPDGTEEEIRERVELDFHLYNAPTRERTN